MGINPDPGWEKILDLRWRKVRIRDKHPGSATLSEIINFGSGSSPFPTELRNISLMLKKFKKFVTNTHTTLN